MNFGSCEGAEFYGSRSWASGMCNGPLFKDFLETFLSSLLSITHSSPCVIRQKENVRGERKGEEEGKIGVVTLILGVQKHDEQANRNEEPGKRDGY